MALIGQAGSGSAFRKWFSFSAGRRLIIIGSAILAGGIVGSLVATVASRDSGYAPRLMTNGNPVFIVTNFRITEGTNHIVSRGSPLMGRINTLLMRKGRKPLSAALPPCTMRTVRGSSVLWVSYKHPRAPLLSIAALLTRPDGTTELIWSKSQWSGGMGSPSVITWVLPSHPTNYPAWGFHIVSVPDGNRFASFEL
jgi:hypothetical protein